MNTVPIGVLCSAAIVFVLTKIHELRHKRRDEKITEMMQRGEGPDRYVTYDGRSLTNIRFIVKKMIRMRENGEL